MFGIEWKINKHAKRQENVTCSEENYQSIETDPEWTQIQIIGMTLKKTKTKKQLLQNKEGNKNPVITTLFLTCKEFIEQRKIWKDPEWNSNGETTMSDMKNKTKQTNKKHWVGFKRLDIAGEILVNLKT